VCCLGRAHIHREVSYVIKLYKQYDITVPIQFRFGTCGGLSAEAVPGCVAVASPGSSYIHRNPDHFHKDDIISPGNSSADTGPTTSPYIFHKLCPSDKRLSDLVVSNLEDAIGAMRVCEGVNITADRCRYGIYYSYDIHMYIFVLIWCRSFYSSQGRVDEADNFNDCNSSLMEDVLSLFPSAASMEMETFSLLHLARCSKKPVHASAAAIVVANRRSALVIDAALLESLEERGGRAILEALVQMDV
jgi:Phosphorylase superfamily